MSDRPILVVDDEPSIRMLVAEFLRTEGFAVLTAPDGAAALALLEEIRPALILLDMQMPVLDGWGFARALREHDSRPPIVVMSAGRNTPGWSDEIGAVACLPKPFDLDELLSTVDRFVYANPATPISPEINLTSA